MHKLAFALLFISFAPPGWTGEKTPPFPLRYQGLHQTKYLELKEILGHPEQTPAQGHTAVLSKDGKWGLYAGGGSADIDGKSDESFLSLWDVPTGQAVKELRIPGKAITTLALHPDGKKALTGLYGSDGKEKHIVELTYWNLETGKAIHTFPGSIGKDKQPEIFLVLTFAPDGKRALASTGGGDVQYLDLESGKKLLDLRLGKEPGACLAMLFIGAEQAVLDWNGELHLWDLKKNASLRTFKGHKEIVFSLSLSNDGNKLASGSLDSSIRVWDFDKGSETAQLKTAGNTPLASVAFTGVKDQLVTVWTGQDPATGTPTPASILLWDPEAKKEIWSHSASLQGLVPLAIQDKHLVLGGGGNVFSRRILATGKEERVWGGHKSPVTALGSFKERLISAGQEGHLQFWKNGAAKHVPGHADTIFALRQGEDGTFLSASADKTVKLWNAKGEVVQTYKGHTEGVTSVVFGPGGKWIASAGGDRVIRTWERESGKPIAVLSGHSEGINALALSPDGKWLATASDDNSVRLWRVEEGKLVKDIDVVILEGHSRQVTSLAFTGDGKQLLSGSQDKMIRVWDVEKQSTVKILKGHQNWISSVLVWNDRAVSAADDFRVIVWDLKKGEVADVIDLTPYGDCPRSLTLAEDGNGFYVGTSGWVIMRFASIKK